MATPEELKLQKELNAEKQRNLQLEKEVGRERQNSVNLSYSLLETLKETLGIQTKSTQEERDMLKINKAINKSVVDRSSSYYSIAQLSKDIRKSEGQITKGQAVSANLAKSLTKEAKLQVKAFNSQTEYVSDLGAKLAEAQKIQETRKDLSKDEAKANADRIDWLKQEKGAAEALLDTDFGALSVRQRQLATTQSQTQELEKQVKKQKELEGGLGVAGEVAELIGKIPGLGGFAQDALGDVTEELQEMQDNGEALPDAFGTANMMVQKLGAGIIKKLMDPMTIIIFLAGQLITAIAEADKQTGEMAKSLNMSYNEAAKLRGDLDDIANLSGDLLVNTQALGESLMAINATLGTNVMLNEKDLKTFTKLREVAGLTNDEIMGIQALSLATGTSLEDNTAEFMAQAKVTAIQNGVLLNEKELLKGIKDVSAATTLSFEKNPKLIGEAVATAKSLGMELSKVEGIADTLLDFESSIESELQAELLLGKDINLEKARTAALNNDLATVAIEIKKQAGSAAEFSKMNRIQQEAIAKAVGLSRDDLAQSLFVQEQLDGLTGEEAKKREGILNARIAEVGIAQAQRELEEEGIENLESQASLGEKFGAIMDKIQDALTPLASLLLGVADALLIVLAPLQLINIIVGAVGKAFTWIGETIGGLIPELGFVGKLLKGIASIGVVYAAYLAYASLAAIPIIGVALGAAAAAAVASAGFGLLSGIDVGDAIIPASGKTQISTGEGQLLNVSPNDDVIAAPGVASAVTGGGSSNKETNALLKMLVTQNSKKPQISPVGLYSVQ